MPKGYPRSKNKDLYSPRKKYARRGKVVDHIMPEVEVIPLNEHTGMHTIFEAAQGRAVIVKFK